MRGKRSNIFVAGEDAHVPRGCSLPYYFIDGSQIYDILFCGSINNS